VRELLGGKPKGEIKVKASAEIRSRTSVWAEYHPIYAVRPLGGERA